MSIDWDHDELISLPRAAALVDVHPNTVRQWAKRGYLEARKFGPSCRTTRAEVLAAKERARVEKGNSGRAWRDACRPAELVLPGSGGVAEPAITLREAIDLLPAPVRLQTIILYARHGKLEAVRTKGRWQTTAGAVARMLEAKARKRQSDVERKAREHAEWVAARRAEDEARPEGAPGIDWDRETQIDIGQAARMIPGHSKGGRVSRQTVYRWMREGHLEAERVHKSYVTTREAVERFLARPLPRKKPGRKAGSIATAKWIAALEARIARLEERLGGRGDQIPA